MDRLLGAALCASLVGCGRLNFDGSTTRDDTLPTTGDAPFVAQCGDQICSGVAGETCGGCGADCNTRAFVCGNSLCDPGEDGATCAADCGPSPWPAAWIAAEDSFRTLLDSARTAGQDCPGMMMPAVGALSSAGDLVVIARVWTYVSVLENGSAVPCNGASLFDIASDHGTVISGGYGAYGSAIDAAAALNLLMNDAARCPALMSSSFTEIGVGHAENAQIRTYHFYLR